MPATPPRRHLCDTRLGQVHCVIAGRDPRPPLVLLHQTPRSVDEYQEVMPRLAEERRVIAFDTPGYGCSDPVAEQPGIPDYAGAILDALDVLGVTRAIPVGHHTGAIIAVELAAVAPERVERVVLSGPIDIDPPTRAWLAPLFQQWTVAPDGRHLGEKWHTLARWVDRPDLTQRLVTDVMRAGTRSEQGHVAATFYAMEERLPLVRCPALLIYGARDPFATRARTPLHRSSFEPVAEVTLEAGVFAPNEAPEAYAAAVLHWLQSDVSG